MKLRTGDRHGCLVASLRQPATSASAPPVWIVAGTEPDLWLRVERIRVFFPMQSDGPSSDLGGPPAEPNLLGGSAPPWTRFAPTRAAGRERLQAALPRLAEYGRDRGFDRANRPTTSQLSPYLQRRLLTEEEVIRAALGAQPWPRVEKFVQEVCWRTYWKGWLEQQPAVWSRYRNAVATWRERERPADYAAAVTGRTGIDGFDAWARQLVEEGWLHNHARMWFASIWIFTLRLPWELGADFFLRHLLDGDPAANTLSWRWVAGLHTPGKTYLARADNIAFHTDGRFHPRGLATEAIAPREPPLPPPRDANQLPGATPGPWTEPVGAWIHPEDLSLDLATLGEPAPVALFAGWPGTIAAAEGWSEPVAAFGQGALADGAGRTAEALTVPVEASREADLAAALTDWARRHQLRTVVAMRPAVGPWREIGDRVAAALPAQGITLAWRQRPWDTQLYPHARRGFFPFWNAARQWLPR